MSKPVQVYMNIYDIHPAETFWDEVDDRKLYKDDAQLWQKQELIDDIRKNGIKYQLNVDSHGNIKNGNMRYWVSRYLLEVEGDERFRFLPVQRNWAAGVFWKEVKFTTTKEYSEEQMHTVMNDIANQITTNWINLTRELTIRSNTDFPYVETDPINKRRTVHYWQVQRNTWNRYYFPQPKNEDTMAFISTISPSFAMPVMSESNAIIDKYKQWTVDNRGDEKTLNNGFPIEIYKKSKKKMKV